MNEVPVNVTLSHLYDATRITDEDLTLNLADFGRQVLRPQVAAVAEGAENQLAAELNGLTADAAVQWDLSPSPEDTEATILAAREAMSDNGVPAGDRWMAVAPDIATRILSVPKFVQVNERGERSALADATLGRLYGFDFVESSALTAGTAVAYHATAFGWGNRPPVPPPGGGDSTTANEGGVSLRHILMFDPTRLATASVVSVFAGASAVPEDGVGTIKRAVRIGTAAA